LISLIWENVVLLTKNLLRIGTAIIFLSAFALPTSVQAQSWPQRTVKFIVPLGPGSGVDIGARLFADRLSKKWGQSVVVENQPGGDGIVAITTFLAANDNHVLLMSPASTFTAHPFLHDTLSYNAADLLPVARVSNTVVSYSVPASDGINTLPELIARAKKEPGKINWASATGMFDFVLSGYLKSVSVEFTRVPYRNPVQAGTDLAEGRIQFMIAAIAIVRPHVQAGKVKMIAVTSKVRAPIAPDVPTTTEAGFPQLATEGLVGLFTTKELATDVRSRIAADVMEVAADPLIAERFTATGQVLNPGAAAEFGTAIEEQKAQAATAAKILGVKAAR
jgi:tripartite-type tricarboxylate transporter receptor subunit TctC